MCTSKKQGGGGAYTRETIASFARPHPPFAGKPLLFPENRVNTSGGEPYPVIRAAAQTARGFGNGANSEFQPQFPQPRGDRDAHHWLDGPSNVFSRHGLAISRGARQHRR